MSDSGAAPEAPIRVFLVDDHAEVRSVVADLLALSGGIDVVGQDGSALTAAAAILAAGPDVAIVDLRLGDGSGIQVCREVSSRDPRIATLVLTAEDDEQAAVAALLAGARGYGLKLVRGAHLVESVREVAAGRCVVDPDRRDRAREWLLRQVESGGVGLGGPALAVLRMMISGQTDRQIAATLQVADEEVLSHVADILVQLEIAPRAASTGKPLPGFGDVARR